MRAVSWAVPMTEMGRVCGTSARRAPRVRTMRASRRGPRPAPARRRCASAGAARCRGPPRRRRRPPSRPEFGGGPGDLRSRRPPGGPGGGRGEVEELLGVDLAEALGAQRSRSQRAAVLAASPASFHPRRRPPPRVAGAWAGSSSGRAPPQRGYRRTERPPDGRMGRPAHGAPDVPTEVAWNPRTAPVAGWQPWPCWSCAVWWRRWAVTSRSARRLGGVHRRRPGVPADAPERGLVYQGPPGHAESQRHRRAPGQAGLPVPGPSRPTCAPTGRRRPAGVDVEAPPLQRAAAATRASSAPETA